MTKSAAKSTLRNENLIAHSLRTPSGPERKSSLRKPITKTRGFIGFVVRNERILIAHSLRKTICAMMRMR